MQKKYKYIFIFSILFVFALSACKSEAVAVKVSPTLVSSSPAEGTISVDVNSPITLLFSEKIALSTTPNIKLNGELVTATVTDSKTLNINATLKTATSYTLVIPNTAIKNVAGNFANEITLKFTTDQVFKVVPTLVSSNPIEGDAAVAVNTPIILQFSEKINLVPLVDVKLNGIPVTATVTDSKILNINATLSANTSYTLVIPNTAIKNDAGNFANEITLKFTTNQTILKDIAVYEAEKAQLIADAAIGNSLAGFTGTGFVNTNSGNVTFTVQVAKTGYYDLLIRYACTKKVNDLYVDGAKIVSLDFSAASVWTNFDAGRIKLSAGTHTISIVKNWGWMQLDNITLSFYGNQLTPFNIDPALITPNPTPEVVKLYNFLKSNFGKKVISGVDGDGDAEWVYQQTGKWPALNCYDFINHTWINQNWVDYGSPLRGGKEYWKNNGVVNLMWHWRDPLTKSGDFYTEKTTFDISKISDTNSPEYRAMIADIDAISSYLKQFKDANIPVIWRPLHEAAGGWFWWGAKGAAPCKALWKLMYDRMVNVHGLNNMIWVWTTNVASDAMDWYPGDQYVDIVGMDIYPGDNQHGSQYFSYNKVKDIFEGRKLITLSECGSAPDPGLMKGSGDMWSWFMTWNGEYTRLDKHNGANWWKKFFSYDYVITRDQMPSLK